MDEDNHHLNTDLHMMEEELERTQDSLLQIGGDRQDDQSVQETQINQSSTILNDYQTKQEVNAITHSLPHHYKSANGYNHMSWQYNAHATEEGKGVKSLRDLAEARDDKKNWYRHSKDVGLWTVSLDNWSWDESSILEIKSSRMEKK